MGEFIIRVADTFGLENPHIVGPDIGTSSSLFAAAAQPGRFRTVVVGSGGAAVPLELIGVLKEWVEATDLEPYRQLGVDEPQGCLIGPPASGTILRPSRLS